MRDGLVRVMCGRVAPAEVGQGERVEVREAGVRLGAGAGAHAGGEEGDGGRVELRATSRISGCEREQARTRGYPRWLQRFACRPGAP